MSTRPYHFIVGAAVARGNGIAPGANIPVGNRAIASPHGPLMSGDKYELEEKTPNLEPQTMVTGVIDAKNPLALGGGTPVSTNRFIKEGTDFLTRTIEGRKQRATPAGIPALNEQLKNSVAALSDPFTFTSPGAVSIQATVAQALKHDALLQHFADIAVPLDPHVGKVTSTAFRPRGGRF